MNLIRHLNPTAPITTEAEAREAGRASAVAIFLGVAYGAFTTWLLTTKKALVLEALAAQAQAQGLQGMDEMVFLLMIWTGVAVVVIQLILGLVQWFRPNIVIPIIFAILVAYGLLSPLLAFVSPQAQQAPMAVWEWGLAYAVLIVQMLLHVAGIRGTSTLDRLRKLGQAD